MQFPFISILDTKLGTKKLFCVVTMLIPAPNVVVKTLANAIVATTMLNTRRFLFMS